MNKYEDKIKTIIRVIRLTASASPFALSMEVIDFLRASLMPVLILQINENLFNNAYNSIYGNDVDAKLFFYASLLGLTTLIHFIIYYVVGITKRIGIFEKNTNQYNIKLSAKMIKLPLIHLEDPDIKNKLQRAQACIAERRMSFIIIYLFFGLGALISMSLLISKMVSYSFWFIPIAFCSVFPSVVTSYIQGKKHYKLKYSQSEKSQQLDFFWSLFTQNRSIKEIRVLGCDEYIAGKWTGLREEMNEELWRFEKRNSVISLICNGIRILGYGLSISFAYLLVLQGQISIGLFGACIAAFSTIQAQTQEVLTFSNDLLSNVRFAEDFFSFLDLPEEQTKGVCYESFKKDIVLSNIYFKYPISNNFALEDVSISIKKGEKVAIVGENGSGKTTFVKLLLGIYPYNQGHIFYDGIELDRISKGDLFKIVSVVQQDFTTYKLTVRENITLSDTKENQDKINSVLEQANLTEIVQKIGGIDSQLGNEFGGVDLSGGQWQKIAIARGIFKENEIIILDEPTAALDPYVETEILSQFIKAVENKTSIIVSHRVGLCPLVDKIILMKEGRVISVGKHENLIESCLEYKNFYTSQSKWYSAI